MIQVADQFLRKVAPNNPEGYRLGFHRPPRNSMYHLHIHMIVLPLREARHEITYGERLTKTDQVVGLLK